jgi:hypothetical protein
VDQLPAILGALATVIAAIGSLELLRRGRTKAAEDRAKLAEADAFRRLVLLRRILLWLMDRKPDPDPVLAKITTDVERETTQ